MNTLSDPTAKALTSAADGSGRMFDGIAARYDLLNKINSFGMDRWWRRAAVRELNLKGGGERVLDLATGTADLPIELCHYDKELRVVGLDPSQGMLAFGQKKLNKRGLETRVELVTGDAQLLPYPADSFDGVTMAFGIRNVPDRYEALREIARVLKPGRRVAILELSEPKNGLLSLFARVHVQLIVPLTGALLSGKREYSYLRNSIEAFPPPEDFETMMREANLVPVCRRSFAFGACVLYVASAPEEEVS